MVKWKGNCYNITLSLVHVPSFNDSIVVCVWYINICAIRNKWKFEEWWTQIIMLIIGILLVATCLISANYLRSRACRCFCRFTTMPLNTGLVRTEPFSTVSFIVNIAESVASSIRNGYRFVERPTLQIEPCCHGTRLTQHHLENVLSIERPISLSTSAISFTSNM